MTAKPRRPRNAQQPTRVTTGSIAVTTVELLLVVCALWYLFTGSTGPLFAWEALALGYLTVGCVIAYQRARRKRRRELDSPRLLEALSWILPLVASAAGIYSAILVLTGYGAGDDPNRAFLAVAGSVGIIVSWLLLHTGFAHIYRSAYATDPDGPSLEFPRRADPFFSDFLYFAFAVGTAFATSDTQVVTTRARWIVLFHSVISFLYNALVVAVAFQVLQEVLKH